MKQFKCIDCGFETDMCLYIDLHSCKPKGEAKMSNKKDLKIGFFWEAKPKESKKKVPTKPYKQLVSYFSEHRNKTIWGVFTGMRGDRVLAHWNGSFVSDPNGHMPLDEITDVVDIVIHEPKEVGLKEAQESDNFGYQAVQGIIESHKDKENSAIEFYVETALKPPFKKKQSLTREEYLQYGKDCYMQGQADEVNRKWDNIFTFKDFDISVKRTWKDQSFKNAVSNAALGLTGEAGEVADLIKKAIYHGRGFDNFRDDKTISSVSVKDELSDVLFYVSAMAQEFGFTLEDVAKHNRGKLEKRFPEGFSTEASAQKVDKAYAKNSNVFN